MWRLGPDSTESDLVAVVVIGGLIAAGGVVMAAREWRKQRARRTQRPVHATVVEVTRSRTKDDEFPFAVRIGFESAGGVRFTHSTAYASEPRAIALAGKYALGTEHKIIPSLDRGRAWLDEDFAPPPRTTVDKAAGWEIVVAVVVVTLTVATFAIVLGQARD